MFFDSQHYLDCHIYLTGRQYLVNMNGVCFFLCALRCVNWLFKRYVFCFS